jgi:cycloartenol synthase
LEGGVGEQRPELDRTLRDGAKRASLCLRRLQLPNGNWLQGSAAGIFNGSCSINYGCYKNIFPVWALGEYARLIDGAK